MEIYTVREGDTLYHIGRRYGISAERLAKDNGITAPDRIPVGENLLIARPAKTVTVREGDTLFSIAKAHGTDLRTLRQLNPALGGGDTLSVGDEVTVRTSSPRGNAMTVGGYVRPDQEREALRAVLPYLTTASVNSAYLDRAGGLRVPEAEEVIALCEEYHVSPLLSVTDEGGEAGREALSLLCEDKDRCDAFAEALTDALSDGGYSGVELFFPSLRESKNGGYHLLLSSVREHLSPLGLSLTVTLNPYAFQSEEEEQKILRAAGEFADVVRLAVFDRESMGESMPIAPIGDVKEALLAAQREIPRRKMSLSLPLYGYDRTVSGRGDTQSARSVSPGEAVTTAFTERAEIRYDRDAEESFYSYYVPESGKSERHDVVFRDVRGTAALLSLADRMGLSGVALYPTYTPCAPVLLYLASTYRIASARKK